MAWGRSKLKPLSVAIRAVVTFMDSDDGKQLLKANPGDAWDPDDLEFWEQHLS